ncbi:hypothetical protein [Ornithinimicrobium sp. LYQ103]|uniref:hypothetical protein n=1 Tax=Ornithinimicrobium sp. LYQ103 TaxID=3378796 RepID=UPI003854C22C
MPDDPRETTSTPGPGRAPVRRRPDLRRFLVVGLVVGAVLGGIYGYYSPDATSSSLGQEVVMMAAVAALLGLLLASVAYLVADRRS